MGQERSRTNGARFGVFYKENLRNDREHVFSHEEQFLKKMRFDLGRPMKRLSRWTIAIAP